MKWPRLTTNCSIDSTSGSTQCSPNSCLVWRSPFSALFSFGFCVRPTIVEVVFFAIKPPCRPPVCRSTDRKTPFWLTIGVESAMDVDLPTLQSTRSTVRPVTADLLRKFFCWPTLVRRVMPPTTFETAAAPLASPWRQQQPPLLMLVIAVLACWSAFWSCFCSPSFHPVCWDCLPEFWVKSINQSINHEELRILENRYFPSPLVCCCSQKLVYSTRPQLIDFFLPVFPSSPCLRVCGDLIEIILSKKTFSAVKNFPNPFRLKIPKKGEKGRQAVTSTPLMDRNSNYTLIDFLTILKFFTQANLSSTTYTTTWARRWIWWLWSTVESISCSTAACPASFGKLLATLSSVLVDRLPFRVLPKTNEKTHSLCCHLARFNRRPPSFQELVPPTTQLSKLLRLPCRKNMNRTQWSRVSVSKTPRGIRVLVVHNFVRVNHRARQASTKGTTMEMAANLRKQMFPEITIWHSTWPIRRTKSMKTKKASDEQNMWSADFDSTMTAARNEEMLKMSDFQQTQTALFRNFGLHLNNCGIAVSDSHTRRINYRFKWLRWA